MLSAYQRPNWMRSALELIMKGLIPRHDAHGYGDEDHCYTLVLLITNKTWTRVLTPTVKSLRGSIVVVLW